jgi:S-adenosyl-L-methionine hydrolase (adenosine-forming)
VASRPTIAFLTDFGLRDHYVGAMKGAALSVCPDATLVDITHDITAQDILEGALELAAAYRYFPAGTVFVAVVDPGVGSKRRGIAAAAGDYFFVAPDNGLLTLVLQQLPPSSIVELTDPQFARSPVSRTFEGRDRFAPAAAWLVSGTAIASLGSTISSYERIDIPSPRVTPDAVVGVVLRVDRFGNLITNIDRNTVEQFAPVEELRVTAGSHNVGAVVATYADAPLAEVCALFGSTDRLEIAVNRGNAADLLGLAREAAVVVTRT